MSEGDTNLQSLPWTGERYLPDIHGSVELEHLHRYLFAVQVTSGKQVLDIASGEGYGSAMLARSAAHVTGVDISSEAVFHAKAKYKADNLEFLEGSCAAIPLPDACVDIVVSFETIEHHDEHEAMMLEIKRVLKPNGLLVISCPDKLEYTDKPAYNNEYHVKELYRDEFVQLLESHFTCHTVFGQRAAYGSLIFQEDKVCLSETYRLADSRMEPVPGLSNSIYLIAIATNGAIPDVKVGLLDQDLLSIKEIVERDEWIVSLSQTVESLIIDRDSQKAGIGLLQNSFEQMTQENDENLGQLYSVVAERDALIGNLGQTAESLIIDRDSHKAMVAQLQVALDKLSRERDEQVSQLYSVVAERDNQIEKFESELTAVYKSKSWRLTSPLRWLIRNFSRVESVIKNNRYANLRLKSSRNEQAIVNMEVEKNAYAENNNAKFRILLVSYYCPTRAHAGGLRILDIYDLIRHQCPNVQIDLFTFHRPSIDWTLDDVNEIFDNVYLSPTEELTPETLVITRGSPLHYDVIDLQFHQSAYQIDAFRLIGSKIIFTPMESLAKVAFINLRTNFLTVDRSRLHKTVASFRSAAEEIRFALKADEVVCVSRSDASFLRAVTFSRHILGVDTGVSQFEFAEAIAPNFVCTSAKNRRCNILYVAYFGSETNVLALRWYLDNVHPIVKANVPDYMLTVVGRGDLSAFLNDQDKSIEFVGEVIAIAPYIQEARVGIAPALAGSGLRGKVNQYAILGVPSVVSPIAHKGLAYQDSKNIFVAEKPEIFAAQCIRLLADFELNDRMGQAARELCLATYSWQSKWPTISKIYNLSKEEVVHDAT